MFTEIGADIMVNHFNVHLTRHQRPFTSWVISWFLSDVNCDVLLFLSWEIDKSSLWCDIFKTHSVMSWVRHRVSTDSFRGSEWGVYPSPFLPMMVSFNREQHHKNRWRYPNSSNKKVYHLTLKGDTKHQGQQDPSPHVMAVLRFDRLVDIFDVEKQVTFLCLVMCPLMWWFLTRSENNLLSTSFTSHCL